MLNKLKLIMPMAGEGSRFRDNGYSEFKPFIDVNGVPMFQHAVNTIGLDFDEKIFIVQKAHDIRSKVLEIYPDAHVIELQERTSGAAATILTAREHMDADTSIFTSNCDQHVEWNTDNFMSIVHSDVDGIIPTFECPERDPKWSYARSENGYVAEVAEKNAISTKATVGFYYWNSSLDFIRDAEQMINRDIRVNGEHYLCPVYNQTIENGGKVVTYDVDRMLGIGTPDDLEAFLQND